MKEENIFTVLVTRKGKIFTIQKELQQLAKVETTTIFTKPPKGQNMLHL